MIRQMTAADVPAVAAVTWAASTDLDRRTGETPPELTPAITARMEARSGHLQETGPEDCWVFEVDGEVVGHAQALRREGMWFLSLLMVRPEHQGTGVGRQLLEQSMTTCTDRSWLTSNVDPAALRRYSRAGFALVPSYKARGPVDRTGLRAAPGVGLSEDWELVDAVVRDRRGAGMTVDIPFLTGHVPLLTVDDAGGRGFAVLKGEGVLWLGATTEDAAVRLLTTALAETTEDADLTWVTAEQQWAVQVCLDARLSLSGGASLCLRGQPPMAPYLPNGALG